MDNKPSDKWWLVNFAFSVKKTVKITYYGNSYSSLSCPSFPSNLHFMKPRKKKKKKKHRHVTGLYERVLGAGTYFFLFYRVSRNFDLFTRKFDLLTRKFDIVSRNFDLLTRKFDLCRIFEILSRNFEILSRIFELISRNFEISYKIKKNMYLALILFRRIG